jgi:hypothetical protein
MGGTDCHCWREGLLPCITCGNLCQHDEYPDCLACRINEPEPEPRAERDRKRLEEEEATLDSFYRH